MPPDKVKGAGQPPLAQAIVPSYLDLRFQPKLRLSVRVVDMDMWPRLLTREEVEAVTTVPKNCRAHLLMLHPSDSVRDIEAA